MIPLSILIFYCGIPLFFIRSDYSFKLVLLTVTGVIFYYIGFYSRKTMKIKKLDVSPKLIEKTILLIFFFSFSYIIFTAKGIPILMALKGSTGEILAAGREDFLKNRTGLENIFKYLYFIFGSILVPVILVSNLNSKKPYILLSLYLFSSIAALAKANFLKLFLPLLFNRLKNLTTLTLTGIKYILFILVLIFVMYKIAGQKTIVFNESGDFWSSSFFSPNILKLISWRIFSIPVITALDWLHVFENTFNGKLLLGQTSNLLSFFIGLPKINFENMVFEYQYGSVGNANAFFIMEAYVNFGIIGVICFSFIIGYIIQLLLKKIEIGILAIPLFAFMVFNTGLIGTLFSNGFILLLTLLTLTNYYEKKFAFDNK